jgi:glycosyltransferase involved in cell wall biosynthesis
MKKKVLILIDILHPSGAENMAINIAVKLKDSSAYSPFVCATRSGGVLEDKLRDSDIEYIVLGRNQSYEFHKFLPLRRIIRDKNVKILHAHKIGSNLWGSLLGSILGLPVISHFHAHHKSLESLNNLVAAKIINRFSSKIISISKYEKKRLINEEGITPSKIVTIYNGIDYSKYRSISDLDLKKRLDIRTETPLVGFVAAFRQQKNHELLMLTAREVLKKNPEVIFLLVGDGETRGKIERMAGELGIERNCRFTGFRNDIPDLISIFNVAVLSSHWEGLPLAVLEYMASSKPVVCTDVSGLSELVEDGVNGFLVKPGDYQEFSDKINTLLNDEELAYKMGKNGFYTVKNNFSEDMMMERIESLYDEILYDHKTS